MVTVLLNNYTSQTRPDLVCMCFGGGGAGQIFIHSLAFFAYTGWEFLTTKNIIVFLEIDVITKVREK